MTLISIPDLVAKFSGSEEFALIDPREQGGFTRGHLLGATNMPFSRLELLIGKTVPRKTTEIILCDDGDGAASRATSALENMGYSNVKTLAGGVSAWAIGIDVTATASPRAAPVSNLLKICIFLPLLLFIYCSCLAGQDPQVFSSTRSQFSWHSFLMSASPYPCSSIACLSFGSPDTSVRSSGTTAPS